MASPKALQGQVGSHSTGSDSWARVGKLGGPDPWASLYASKAGMHQVLLHMPSDYALLAVLQVVLLQAGAHCAGLACCKGAAVAHWAANWRLVQVGAAAPVAAAARTLHATDLDSVVVGVVAGFAAGVTAVVPVPACQHGLVVPALAVCLHKRCCLFLLLLCCCFSAGIAA